MATEKIIKKYVRKADKELEKFGKVQNDEADLLLDKSKGPITYHELVEEIEPKSKAVRRHEKTSRNAELNVQRAKKNAKP
jgi:phosphomevalonate kinase